MMREAFEKGLASVVARWMLDGSAEAVIARVANSGVLKPEEVEALRHDTTEHLKKVRDEGAAYAEVVTTALREVAAHLPLSGLASVAVTAAGAIPWKETVSLASRMAMEVATKSAQAAAIHAQTLHETLEAQRQKQAQARADGKEAEAATAPAEETSASEANTPSAEANSAVAPTEPADTTAPSAADAAGSVAFADAEAEVPAAAKEEA